MMLVQSLGLASLAQVVVGTLHALVAESTNGSVATIANYIDMERCATIRRRILTWVSAVRWIFLACNKRASSCATIISSRRCLALERMMMWSVWKTTLLSGTVRRRFFAMASATQRMVLAPGKPTVTQGTGSVQYRSQRNVNLFWEDTGLQQWSSALRLRNIDVDFRHRNAELDCRLHVLSIVDADLIAFIVCEARAKD